MVIRSRPFLRNNLADLQDVLSARLEVGRPSHKLLEVLLLLGGVGGNPCFLGIHAVQEIRYEHEGSLKVSRETVSSLEGLRCQAEDIIDIDDGLGGSVGAGDVYSWGQCGKIELINAS